MTANTTDYEFPDGWGLYSDEQKSLWFMRQRVFRQAVRQSTHFGRKYEADMERNERMNTDHFRVDEDLE